MSESGVAAKLGIENVEFASGNERMTIPTRGQRTIRVDGRTLVYDGEFSGTDAELIALYREDMARGCAWSDRVSALVELLWCKGIDEGRDPNEMGDEHRAAGSPAPDSGHPFWNVKRLPEFSGPEDLEEWSRLMRIWKEADAECRRLGVTEQA